MATPAFVALGAANPIISTTTAATPITWNHTVNAGEILILVVLGQNLLTPSAFTYNGVAGTLIASNTTLTTKAYLYGWLSPATGTNTVSWTPGEDGITVTSCSLTYSGADTGTGWHNAGSATGTTDTPAVAITSSSGDRAIGFFVSRSFAPITLTGEGTSRFSNTSGMAAGADVGDEATASFSWTVGAAGDDWTAIGACLIGGSTAVNISPSVGNVPVTGLAPAPGHGIGMPDQAMSITGRLFELIEIRASNQILIGPA